MHQSIVRRHVAVQSGDTNQIILACKDIYGALPLLVLCDRTTGCMLQDKLTRAASRACLAPSGHLQEVMRSCCHSDACTAFPVAYGLNLGS